MFNKMLVEGNNYKITSRVKFCPKGKLDWSELQVSYDFAYDMTFGKRGEHRAHRSGGSYKRKNGEIFRDTFQGKLAECAVKKVLEKKHKVNVPSTERWELGKWDSSDFLIDGKKASVKSTKSYGNLLLLETRDYDENGVYIPNKNTEQGGECDYFILIRMNPFCDEILKRNRLLYSENVKYNDLMNLMKSVEWKYDIPGFITRDDFRYLIKEKFIIPMGAMLNGSVKMDAENYYVQVKDMRPIEEL